MRVDEHHPDRFCDDPKMNGAVGGMMDKTAIQVARADDTCYKISSRRFCTHEVGVNGTHEDVVGEEINVVDHLPLRSVLRPHVLKYVRMYICTRTRTQGKRTRE